MSALNANEFKADIDFSMLDFTVGEADFHAQMDELLNEILQPKPFLDPVVWAFESIEINTGFRQGKIRLTGFQRPVAYAALDPVTDQITVLKGVQVGWSTFLKIMLLYGVSYLALSVILTQPTDADASGYYKDQIEPHFSDPIFSEIRRTPKRGEAADTWDEHRFKNGGQLYMRGAASDDAFRRISAAWQMGDEVDADAWQSKSEKSQGDKISLFRDRGTAFSNPVMWVGSTPVERSSSLVWREWLLSDQRRFYVTCPHCGESQYLKWGAGSKKSDHGFRWSVNELGHVDRAWYVCEANGCEIDEKHKETMVENGEFIPTAVPNRPGHRGFHWPAWHSMAPGAAWKNLATQWIEAQKALKNGDVELLKRFINNVLAEPWDDLGGDSLDEETLNSRQIAYPAEVPDDVVVLTAGVDTQTNKEGRNRGLVGEQLASREISVVGWNARRIPRVIGHWVVVGEPGDPEADAELDAILQRKFKRRDGSEMSITATAVDMGGNFGDQTKAYAANRKSWRVWAIKGRNAALGTRSASVWPRKVSSSRSGSAVSTWFMIDTQLAKDAVGRMLSIRGPGGPSFPMSLPPEYFEGLAAEKKITDKKGKKFWKRRGANTGEEWDCLIYAYSALCGLQASYRGWRDLNLAGKKLGIDVDPPHDPETGEILDDYHGPDMSALSNKTASEASDIAAKSPAVADNTAPKTAPAPVAKPKKKRKRRPVVVKSSRW